VKLCLWCNQEFTPTDINQRYCKKTHQKAANKKRNKDPALKFEKMAAEARFLCSTPEKKKYATKELAQSHIDRAVKIKPELDGILSAYKCQSCEIFWHLTSH